MHRITVRAELRAAYVEMKRSACCLLTDLKKSRDLAVRNSRGQHSSTSCSLSRKEGHALQLVSGPREGGAGLWNDDLLEPFGNRLRCTVKVVNYARDLVAGLWCDLDPELFGLGLQPLIVKGTTKRLAQDLQTVIRNPWRGHIGLSERLLESDHQLNGTPIDLVFDEWPRLRHAERTKLRIGFDIVLDQEV